MPFVYLSPSTQEGNYYVSGGTEEQYMNLLCDQVIPYLDASGIAYTRNDVRCHAFKRRTGRTVWQQARHRCFLLPLQPKQPPCRRTICQSAAKTLSSSTKCPDSCNRNPGRSRPYPRTRRSFGDRLSRQRQRRCMDQSQSSGDCPSHCRRHHRIFWSAAGYAPGTSASQSNAQLWNTEHPKSAIPQQSDPDFRTERQSPDRSRDVERVVCHPLRKCHRLRCGQLCHAAVTMHRLG